MQSKTLGINTVRGGLRRLGHARGRSSYPFISGDTYASLCDFIYSGDFMWVERKLRSYNSGKINLFLPASFKDSFLKNLLSSSVDFIGSNLVIHNYDNIPTPPEMAIISKRFQDVFCVNWLGDRRIATPIPIGLENWGHLRNGVPRDFSKIIESGMRNFNDREINLLASFSLSTNINARAQALKFLGSYPDKYQMKDFASPQNYRELILNSKFVISPPGNGPDCHRTWEAIYLGAVPIVLQKYWPFGHMNLPVLVVNDWFDIPKAIDSYVNHEPASIETLRRLFLESFIS